MVVMVYWMDIGYAIFYAVQSNYLAAVIEIVYKAAIRKPLKSVALMPSRLSVLLPSRLSGLLHSEG